MKGLEKWLAAGMLAAVAFGGGRAWADAHDGVQLWEGGPYWAETNIGAEEPWEYGLYFWWGDTVGYWREGSAWVASDGSAEDFKFDEGNTPTYGKNNATLQSEGWITAEGVLAPEHDAAQVQWGGGWRMPTDDEFSSLLNNCDWTWTATNGVNGYVVRGKGDFAEASIFVPAAGYGSWTRDDAGYSGHVWSSVPLANEESDGSGKLYFNCFGYHAMEYGDRSGGYPIRPLRESAVVEPVKYPITVGDGVSWVYADDGEPRTEAAAGETLRVEVGYPIGMRLVGVYVNGERIEGTTFVMPAEAVTVTAEYEPEEIEVDQRETVDGVEWCFNVYNGEATVTGASPAVGELVVPAELGGYPVTAIEDYAFFHDGDVITSLRIPDSVRSVGLGAFANCSVLTALSVPGAWKGTDILDNAGVPEGCQVVYRGAEDTGIHNGVQLWEDGPYWAETNIGAEEPWEYGLYFWWGDTVGYKREGSAWVASDGSSENFSFSSGNTPTDGKNNATLQSEGWITAEGVLAPEHDAAQVHWGGGWRMPTYEEFVELVSNTTTRCTTSNGVYGRLVIGKGDYASASIFLPAAGGGCGKRLDGDGMGGGCWSSTPYSSDSYHAWDLEFYSFNYYEYQEYYRYYGQSIRPVRGAGGMEPVKYPITVGDGVEGVYADNGESRTEAAAGETLTVEVGYPIGMRLVGVYVNGERIEGTTFVMPTEAVTVTAEYEAGGALTLELAETRVTEGAGGVRCVVRRTGAAGKALEVGVASSRPGDVRVPGTVVIAAGVRSGSFTAEVVDNASLDGERTAVLTVSAEGYGGAEAELTVVDDEVPALTLEAESGSVREGGTLRVQVSREGSVAAALAVQLSGLGSGQVTGPSSVAIAAGERSAVFEVSVPDNDVAQAETAVTLRAAAAGYGAAVLEFVVVDDDVPGVRLELHPDVVGEGAGGNAVLATLSRTDTGKGLEKAITVQLAASPAGQVVMPAAVTIPANTVSVRFGITPVDNGAVDGEREVTLNGLVAIASCGCGGQPSDGEAIRAVLRVTDDDVPSLSLRAEPTTMKEGLAEAGWLVLGHNSALANDLKVTLGADQEGEISIPATATIRAGETAVRVPVRTLDDGIEDGGKLVVVRAEDPSGAFAPASTWLQVSDQNLPDLAVVRVETAATAVTKAEFAVRFAVTNAGFAACTRTVPYAVHVVRALGVMPGSNTVVATGALPVGSGLPVGGTLEAELEVAAPELPGDAWVAVVLDPDGLVPELDNANNTGWSGAVGVAAAWTATVAADAETYLPGDAITLAGAATLAGGGAASGVDVDVYLLMDGMRRTLKARTGTDGAFAAVFTPSAGEAGHYGAGACYPGAASGAVQDEFDVLGMRRASADNVIWDIALGDAETRTVTLRNMSGTALTGLTAAFAGVPAGCGLSWELPGTLEGNGSAAFKITATATGLTEQVEYEKFSVRIGSAEGAELEFPLYFHAQAQKAYLRATPGSIDTTMAVGHERYIDVTVVNDGKGDSGAVSAAVPDVPWLKVVGGERAENLASGGSMTVTLLLCPEADGGLALNRPLSGGSLAVNCANGNGCRIPLKFTPVSEATGSLRVTATDDNTYHLESAPNLAGAEVRVGNPYTGATVASGKTGADGTWTAEGLPEGTYRLTVSAANHETWVRDVTVEPETEARVWPFLQCSLIKVSWDVQKTEIGDSYDIQLVCEYETSVPAPIVRVDGIGELPALDEGETFTFAFTYRNTGVIAAESVSIRPPDIPGYEFELGESRFRLPAGASKSVVIRFRRPKRGAAAREAIPGNMTQIANIYAFHNTIAWLCGRERPSYTVPKEVKFGEKTDWKPHDIPDWSGLFGSKDDEGEPARYPDGYKPSGPGGFTGGGGTPQYPTKADCDTPVWVRAIWNLNPLLAPYRFGFGVYDLLGKIDAATGKWDAARAVLEELLKKGAGLFAKGQLKKGLGAFISDIGNKTLIRDGVEKSIRSAVGEVMDWAIGSWIDRHWETRRGGARDAEGDAAAYAAVRDTIEACAEELRMEPELLAGVFFAYRWLDAQERLVTMALGGLEVGEKEVDAVAAAIEAILALESAGRPVAAGDLAGLAPQGWSEGEIARLAARWNAVGFDREGMQEAIREIAALEALCAAFYSADEPMSVVHPATCRAFELYGEVSRSGVCASVSIQLSQTLAMTREAFDGTLTMYNGHGTEPIRDLKLEVSVLDEEGNECKDLFEAFANGTAGDMGGEDVLAGGLSVPAGGTGSAMLRFIPERGAAPTEEKLYRFGGRVTYTDPFSGERATIELVPVALTVSPSPYLHLDYFVQRDVYGDDPFTGDVVEASLPAELAVLVRNVGGGEARNVTISGVQPETVRNEKGLAIDFRLSDYSLDRMALNGATAHLGLTTASLGTIPAGASQVAQWWLTASIQGHFTGMSATVVPVNSWNTPDTMLVDTNVAVHKLIRSVVADADGLPDFLTSGEWDLYGLADTIWTAAGQALDVAPAGSVAVSGTLSGSEVALSMAMTATVRGWTYGWAAVPGAERYEIARVARADGSEVPLRNAWITDRVFRDGADPVWETRLHLLDECAVGEQAYTVTLAAKAGSGPAVVLFEGVADGALVAAPPDVLTVVFSADVDGTTFGTEDLTLRHQGRLVDVPGLSVSGAGTRWTISGLGSVCAADGLYELVVQAAGIAGTDGVLGSVGRSVSWTVCGDTTGPTVLAVVRETGLQGEEFRVALSEAPAAGAFPAATLVRDGTAVALPGGLSWEDDGCGWLRLRGLESVTGTDGAYVLTVEGSGLRDAAGNAGNGRASVSWTVETTAPAEVSGLRIDPDLGESALDGVTCDAAVTVRGTLAADASRVTLLARRGADAETVLAGPFTPGSTNLACAVELPGAGNLVLAVRCEDAAGNAAETAMDVYLDTVAAEASWDAVETAGAVPVDCAVLRFSPAVVAGDVTAARLSLTRDGRMVPLRSGVAVAPLSGAADGTAFEVTGLSERCTRPGRYALRFDAEGVRKASSGLPMPQNAGASVEWTQASPEVGVSGLSARQRYPWNGLVDIDYEVSGDGSGAADTWVEVAARDAETGGTMPVWSVTGDGADGPLAEGVYRMTWDMAADRGGELVTDSLVVRMATRRGDAAYLVVDMSGGREASHWPVSGLPGVPAGGWTEEYKTTKLVLRRVEPGTSAMGSPEDEPGRAADEVRHTVTLTRTYWMGVFEVTQKQWELAMGTHPAGCLGDARPVEGVSYRDIRGWTAGAGWSADGEVDADSFLGVLREKTRMAFDLPTEAQWERACRAETGGALNSGKALSGTVMCPNLSEIAKYAGNGPKHGADDGLGGPEAAHAAVGSYRPNAWGLYDMHGNVAEWCLDWVGDYRHGISTDPAGSPSGVRRAVRGGSWDDSAMDCRSAARGEGAPGNATDRVGFRLCWVGGDVPDPREEQEIEWEEIGVQTVGNSVMLAATAESGGRVEYKVVSGPATLSGNVLTFTGAGTVVVRATQAGDASWAAAFVEQTIAVGKKKAKIDVSGKIHLWDGMAKEVAIQTRPTGLAVKVAYDGVPTPPSSAGVHDVEVTVDDPDYEGNTRETLVIVEQGQCLVVDMSGGADALTWPVETLDEVPENQSVLKAMLSGRLFLRRVEPGTFAMGSPTNELGRTGNETRHSATLTKPYWMGVYPVTSTQWRLAMGADPSFLAPFYGVDIHVWSFPVNAVSYADIRGASAGAGWPGNGAVDANSFLGVLRAKTGLAFDLPTEAQWEHACRAGTMTALNSGKNLPVADEYPGIEEVGACNMGKVLGWFDDIDIALVHSDMLYWFTVGRYLPNAWGFYDMHGTVDEWCLDWFGAYEVGKTDNPAGPATGTMRVVRGGNWGCPDAACRSASRKGFPPTSTDRAVGFRLCCPVGDDGVLKEQTIQWTSGVSTQAVAGGSMVLGATATGGGTVAFEVISGPATLAGNVLTFTGAGTVVVRATQVGDASWAAATLDAEIVVAEAEPLYMVLDLSGGTNAASYGVSYLADVPEGGWTDEFKTTKLVLRRIEPGTFTMGCETNEVGYTGLEAVPHEVTISQSFYMGVFEVTQKQWELVMGSNPSSYTGDIRPVERVSWDTIRGNSSTYNWPASAEVDAASFMGKLRARAGGFVWDLPTEAQWEYACRAGTTTALNSGKNLTGMGSCTNMAEVGRYGCNQSDGKGGYSQHTAVGSYLPNAWGLYDMHGNVLEWTLDWFQSRSGFTADAITDPVGPASGSNRVRRGGSWGDYAQICRSAYRYFNYPSNGSNSIGLRLCCSAGLP